MKKYSELSELHQCMYGGEAGYERAVAAVTKATPADLTFYLKDSSPSIAEEMPESLLNYLEGTNKL